MAKEERANEPAIPMLRLNAELFNQERENKLGEERWHGVQLEIPACLWCEVKSCLNCFYISIKGIKVTLPLAALRISDGIGPGYQRCSINVKLWMTIKGWVIQRMTDGGASRSPTPQKFSLRPD